MIELLTAKGRADVETKDQVRQGSTGQWPVTLEDALVDMLRMGLDLVQYKLSFLSVELQLSLL